MQRLRRHKNQLPTREQQQEKMQQCLRALKKKYQIRKSGSNGKKTSHTLSRFQQIPIKLWFTATDHQKHFSAALEKEMLVRYFDPFDNFSNWKPKLHEKCWAWLVAGREIWAKCSIETEVYVHVNIRKISSLFICAKSWVGFKNTEQRRGLIEVHFAGMPTHFKGM